MKRILFILLVIMACHYVSIADHASRPYRLNTSSPYIDDSYYWPQADTLVSAEPVYDKNMREFIFLEDTAQHSDTVRMRIIGK